MATTTERAAQALIEHLLPGERVLAATRAQLAGGTVRIGLRNAAAGPAAVVSMAGSDDPDIDKQLARGAAVAVTDRRLIVMNVTAMGANPKDPVLIADRQQVTDFTAGTKRIMMIKVPTFGFTVPGPDGGPCPLSFEVAKAHSREGNDVIAALRR